MTTTDPALGIPVVYLVDDEDVVRDALGWLLRSCRLLSEGFASAQAFEAHIDRQSDAWPSCPSCLLLDVRMPGVSGLALFDRLIERQLLPKLPVIFLTGHGDVPTAVSAVKRGAFDFVEKPFANNSLIDRVRLALQASAQALQADRRLQVLARALAELSPRELEVMHLVLEGRPNKLVADALGVSVRTVEAHRARIFDKMKVRSALELSHVLKELQRA